MAHQPGHLDLVPRIDPANLQQQGGPSFISRLLQMLQSPAVSEGLIATGAGLLAQSDRPGTLGGALGRALPGGIQAGRAAGQRADFEQMLEGLDPRTAGALRILGPERGGAILAQSGLAPAPSPVTLGEGDTLVDPTSGQTIAQNAASPDFTFQKEGNQVAVFRTGPDGVGVVGEFEFDETADFSDASTLRSQFNGLLGEFDAGVSAFNKVAAAASASNPTAADDLAMIFGFMKSVDPTSSVREGEFANASNAGGVDARIRNLFNQIQDGTRLTPAQRAEFVKTAREQVLSGKPLFDASAQFYSGVATRNNLNPADVIRDPFAGLAPESDALPDPLGIRR